LAGEVKVKLRLIGIEEEFLPRVREINAASLEPFVDALTRIPHSRIPTELDDIDFFILPYPEGRNFQNRFPLKALEYASLRKPIIATRTVSHESIFSDEEVWFYSSNECDTMIEVYEKMCKSVSERDKKCDRAFNLAKTYTYDYRVARVLDAVLAIQ
jgi:glycosyltransferase involved in cell wall biosynthesis